MWKVKRDLKIFGQSAPQLNPQPVILSTLKFSAITYSKGLKHGPEEIVFQKLARENGFRALNPEKTALAL